MAIFNYEIGGNEVKVDANESIADIPSNRTLLVQKLTDEAPIAPESVYGLQTIDDVFERFEPSVQLEYQDENGQDVSELMVFKNLADFDTKQILGNSDFLSRLEVEKEQNIKIARQLSSNKALLKALENPATRAAIVEVIEASIQELSEVQQQNNPKNEEL